MTQSSNREAIKSISNEPFWSCPKCGLAISDFLKAAYMARMPNMACTKCGLEPIANYVRGEGTLAFQRYFMPAPISDEAFELWTGTHPQASKREVWHAAIEWARQQEPNAKSD